MDSGRPGVQHIGTVDSKRYKCCNHPDRAARLPSHVLCAECFSGLDAKINALADPRLPTTQALSVVLEALRQIERDWRPGSGVREACDPFDTARAALATWEARLPLREDEDVDATAELERVAGMVEQSNKGNTYPLFSWLWDYRSAQLRRADAIDQALGPKREG